MIDFNYRKFLLFQFLYLIAASILAFLIFLRTNSALNYFLFWPLAVSLNLIYIKLFILPRASAEIEESFARKDEAYHIQKKELEQEHIKYKRILDNLHDSVFILNKDLHIIYANRAFKNHFDLWEKKFPVSLIVVTRNLEFRDFLKNAVIESAAKSKKGFTFNSLHDPYKTFFDLHIFPLDERQNYLCTFHDVTEQKMLEIVREDFVANFSHEVRTPLTIVNGQIQSLKAMLLPLEEYTQKYESYFEKIENNSRRLINLFNDLLQLVSIESKKEINKEKVDIEILLEMLIEDLKLNYPDKQVSFEFDLKQKVFLLNYNLIEQALLNLIDNALKYSKAQGIVKFSSYSENGWDHLIISDSGVGIPEELQHRIFERFFRVDNSRNSKVDGTGLGLSIVKHIIQKHEGKIKVQSKLNAGTSFTLTFPAA